MIVIIKIHKYQNIRIAKEFKVSPHAVRKSIKQSIVLLKKKAEKYGIKKEDLIYFSK